MSTLRQLGFARIFRRPEQQSGELEDSGGLGHAESLGDEGGCASGFILRLGSVDGGMKNDVSAKQ